MAKMIKMIVVLSAISFVAGLALGGLNSMTRQAIADNVLKYKKLPAVLSICESIEGELDDARRAELEQELLATRTDFELPSSGGDVGATTVTLFTVRRDGAPYAVVFEESDKGYGGDVGVMVGIELDGSAFAGAGITTHSETPGVGSKVTEPQFLNQFRNMALEKVALTKDGGRVDGISGATYSSRAVAASLDKGRLLFQENQEAIRKAVAE